MAATGVVGTVAAELAVFAATPRRYTARPGRAPWRPSGSISRARNDKDKDGHRYDSPLALRLRDRRAGVLDGRGADRADQVGPGARVLRGHAAGRGLQPVAAEVGARLPRPQGRRRVDPRRPVEGRRASGSSSSWPTAWRSRSGASSRCTRRGANTRSRSAGSSPRGSARWSWRSARRWPGSRPRGCSTRRGRSRCRGSRGGSWSSPARPGRPSAT